MSVATFSKVKEKALWFTFSTYYNRNSKEAESETTNRYFYPF